MTAYRQIFPGLFTMGNMFCGFAAILSCIKGGNPNEAAWLIIFAAFFDFLDGIVARLSKSASSFGVQLDSLADVVSFCVAPAVLLYSYKLVEFGNWGWIIGFTFIMAGTYRLARYNLTAKIEEKGNFLGLPVPVPAVAIASFVIFSEHLWGEIRLDRFLIIMVFLFSALMVSTIEYETMPKFDFSVKRNRIKVLVIFGAAILLMVKTRLVMFPLVSLYALSGVYKLIFGLIQKTVLNGDGQLKNEAEKDNKNG
ncbi:MAG: CDP-diacylglycerol--serine O-phosphatidyltransferase [candidate division Zixibacteria bacterium]|nr:CDP-diacylglycerol--serine O-phosphatidyltransferase [candidate division Zixibacteria bacterium]